SEQSAETKVSDIEILRAGADCKLEASFPCFPAVRSPFFRAIRLSKGSASATRTKKGRLCSPAQDVAGCFKTLCSQQRALAQLSTGIHLTSKPCQVNRNTSTASTWLAAARHRL